MALKNVRKGMFNAKNSNERIKSAVYIVIITMTLLMSQAKI